MLDAMFGFTLKGVITPRKKLFSNQCVAHIKLKTETVGSYYVFGASGVLHYIDSDGKKYTLNAEMGDWLIYTTPHKVELMHHTNEPIYMMPHE